MYIDTGTQGMRGPVSACIHGAQVHMYGNKQGMGTHMWYAHV